MRKVVKVLNYIMLLLFATAAVLQYNDPDSLIWIIAYGLTAAVCILWIQETQFYSYIAGILAIIYLGWSFYIIPESVNQQLFSSFGMQSIEIEEMRETLGLLIMAAWMFVLALVPQRKEELKRKQVA